MNPVLQLKGPLQSRKSTQRFGPPSLPAGCRITSQHLSALREELAEIIRYWETNPTIGGALVNVHYRRVVPKSSRLSILLAEGKKNPAASICGAKFESSSEPGRDPTCHVFTHFVSLSALRGSRRLLDAAAKVVENDFAGTVLYSHNAQIATGLSFPRQGLSKNDFLKALVDADGVTRFSVPNYSGNFDSDTIVSLYRTGDGIQSTLAKFGINVFGDKILDDSTVLLSRAQLQQLLATAPYLVSMGLVDLRQVPRMEPSEVPPDPRFLPATLPHPGNEPIVGVIDTQFDERAYFAEWVEYHKAIDDSIPLDQADYYHGTAVSSIIVDGHRTNPDLDDGCGHFRVRHFGVAKEGRFSSFQILRAIRRIVAANLDIKVWNLSLGSVLEVSPNCISPEAAELDRIQKQYDVLFVVAGTNIPPEKMGAAHAKHPEPMRLGAPADSLNSVVVNSVDATGSPASYTRVGPVLSFFDKPDVACFGGDRRNGKKGIIVCIGDAPAQMVFGTSFAAPWIARKMAFMIGKLGLSREIAKALLLDAAAKWGSLKQRRTMGYGIVPKTVGEILNTPNDEIRFFLSGVTEEYETYTYEIPVPVAGNSHPYFARAVLVYFPWCDRSQGVDYTGTELDVRFGRVKDKNGKKTIETINRNTQGDPEGDYIDEKSARSVFRKWDNVKRISEPVTPQSRPRRAYGTRLWGLSIRSKARNPAGEREKLPFGVVVTLREMNGVNRIDDFIQQCFGCGWIVNRIDVEAQVEVYNQGQMELSLE